MELTNVSPGLVIAIYIFVEFAKIVFIDSDKFKKLIPLVCACLGIVVSVVLYFIYPDLIGCSNALDAVATGGMSGLAATGCNQLYKQLSKFTGLSNDDTEICDEMDYVIEDDIYIDGVEDDVYIDEFEDEEDLDDCEEI